MNTKSKSAVPRRADFGDSEISFMLSGDFIEFNSHCELDPAFQYEPDNDADYTGYQDDLPHIFIGPEDQIYEAADAYPADGTETGRDFRKVEHPYFLFRTKLDYYGKILYAYAFSAQSEYDHQMLGLEYSPALAGTPLEQKLTAALDEAAATYTETRMK